ncbi:MAG: C69 family dipeptidase [Thermomicrobiales bacterium]
MRDNDPLSCDTSVVVPPLTRDGSVIFAKNSDRSVNECQPLVHIPRMSHDPDTSVRTQYLTIPQVETTWEMIGSAPWWLWGFEMGVNEWGVTIGNEAVHTREPTHHEALIGMDLVRLGLERAITAEQAVTVIGRLVETYGQGGSCEATHYRTYQNSFIVADANAAWILETAGHRWVATSVKERGAISNLLTISDSWDDGSPGVREHAVAQGWWRDPGGFAAAYQDPEADLTTRTCRLERARDLLGRYQTGVGVADMMAVLRDHSGGDLPTGPERLPTICMHSNPAFPGETAAAMVVRIRPNRPKLLTTTIWTAFGSPCLSVFRPVYPLAAGLPDDLSKGSAAYDAESPWWVFERLQRLVARSPGTAGVVRAAFATLEQEFFGETEQAETIAAEQLAAGDQDGATTTLRTLVDETTSRAIALARQLTTTLPQHAHYSPHPALSEHWDALDAAVYAAGVAG